MDDISPKILPIASTSRPCKTSNKKFYRQKHNKNEKYCNNKLNRNTTKINELKNNSIRQGE